MCNTNIHLLYHVYTQTYTVYVSRVTGDTNKCMFVLQVIQPVYVCVTRDTTSVCLCYRLHVIQPVYVCVTGDTTSVCLCYTWYNQCMSVLQVTCDTTSVCLCYMWYNQCMFVLQVTRDTISVCLCYTWYNQCMFVLHVIQPVYVCVTGYTWYNQCMFVLQVTSDTTSVCLCYRWYHQCMFVLQVTHVIHPLCVSRLHMIQPAYVCVTGYIQHVGDLQRAGPWPAGHEDPEGRAAGEATPKGRVLRWVTAWAACQSLWLTGSYI